MIQIDGCQGEGGGQILRTSLALSLVTRKPFHITRIRAGRGKPGLLPQHLTAVNAAAAIGQAKVDGGELGSLELTFTPQEVRPGEYRFSVGTAGSATLVLQTVLPPLLFASGPSRLTLSGGTHNTHAPPFDFLANAFAPLLARLASPADPAALSTPGGETAAKPLEVQLVRPGFYPAGGGEFTATITPPGGAGWSCWSAARPRPGSPVRSSRTCLAISPSGSFASCKENSHGLSRACARRRRGVRLDLVMSS
jgi:RNA 3'-terminal phosphate cyclase (ATP)